MSGSAFGKNGRRQWGRWRSRCAGNSHRRQRYDQGVALDFSAVGGGLLEVEHHARAVARLHHVDRLQVALVKVDQRAADGVGSGRKIERDARGRLDGKTCGHRQQGLREQDAHNFCTTLHIARHGLNGAVGEYQGGTHGSS